MRAKTGRNERIMISTEKKIGRPTVRQAWMTISVVSPVTRSSPKCAGQVVRGVLAHHDRLVDQDADGDRDPGQAHDVRRDAEEPHHQEAEQDRQRQRDATTNALPRCPITSRIATCRRSAPP